jgi:hypothetical protein
VKRAELIIGKAYYINTEAGWRNRSYIGNKSYYETANRNKNNKVTIVETQLKTEYDRSRRTREVMVRYESGKEQWVPLNHIRCTWKDAVRIKTEDCRIYYFQDNRAHKYSQHLARKVQREQYNPAYKAMVEGIKELTGDGVYGWDKIENGFSLEQLKVINEALSLLKTQKPVLMAVAS